MRESPPSRDRPLVYFFCIGNAMRSQIAEAFLRHHAGDRYEVASAGTHPFGSVMPEVTAVMQEKGLDLSSHTSDPIDPDLVARADLLVDLGGRAAPLIPRAFADKFRAWEIADPYGSGDRTLRRTRDQIEGKVLALIEELDRRFG